MVVVVQLCHATHSSRMNYQVRSQGADQISSGNDMRASQLMWRSVGKGTGGVERGVEESMV